MRQISKLVSLLLLLIAAQHGAVVHELSHFSGSRSIAVQAGPAGLAEAACALCPAFAQAASPAFSHSFQIPLLDPSVVAITRSPRYSAPGLSGPQPRSRGPPAFS